MSNELCAFEIGVYLDPLEQASLQETTLSASRTATQAIGKVRSPFEKLNASISAIYEAPNEDNFAGRFSVRSLLEFIWTACH